MHREFNPARRLGVALLIAGWLTGCGGGGSGASSNPTGSASSDPNTSGNTGSTVETPVALPAVSLSMAEIRTGTDTSRKLESIQFQVVFADGSKPHFNSEFHWKGTAIGTVDWTFGGGIPDNTIEVQLYNPGQLGAGVYTDTLTVTICADATCTKQYPNSPLTLPVTYTVTGSATPTSTFSLQASAYYQMAHTADTTSPKFIANLNVQNLPLAGLYARWLRPTGPAIADIQFQASACFTCVGDAGGQFTFTLKDPRQMAPGTYTDAVSVDVCFDQECTRPLPNSPGTVPITYQVYASEGREYRSLVVPVYANDVAWNAQEQRLYATVLDGSQQYAKSLVKIDPETGSIGASLLLNGTPSRLALSDDGQFGYVSLPDQGAIQRIHLPDMTADLLIPLGNDSNGTLRTAARMAVAPGAAHTLAVAFSARSSNDSSGAAIYDDAVARPQQLTPLTRESVNSVVWSGDRSTLYVSRYVSSFTGGFNLDAFAVTSSGLGAATVLTTSQFYLTLPPGYSEINLSAARLYDNAGRVFDATNGTLLGTLELGANAGSPSVLPDAASGKSYAVYRTFERSDTVLTVFDNATFKSLTIAMPESFLYGDNRHLVRWGPRGLAVIDTNRLIILSGTLINP
jgi:hypothetical protein